MSKLTAAALAGAVALPLALGATGATAADIVDTAVEAGSFETLVTAVQAAGLVETLKGEGPFTVFAPTDEAFAALPEGTLEALLEDTEQLTAVLTYHVVAGEVMAADVVGLDTAETVNGDTIDITVDGDTVMVDQATVIQADVMADNGVIHVIDQVILPD
ncbi:MAG: fasciclin domain-containing protein [Azospirillaceae bacterium]